MGHRLIEVYVPAGRAWDVSQVLEDVPVLGSWHVELAGETTLTRILVNEGDTEAALNRLEDRFEGVDGFRAVLLLVEATLPRPEPDEEAVESAAMAATVEEERTRRISIQELYDDVSDSFSLDRVWLALVMLSAIVAAIGLIRGSTVVVIGAMVIAPLLGPNMGLSLATTLADAKLAKRALLVSMAGVGAAFAVAVVVGLALHTVAVPVVGPELVVDPAVPQIGDRTTLDLADIALALASGAAGALSFTLGLSAALIGVMVAVALLPPLVVAGLLVGVGQLELAVSAGLLAMANLIGVNLAGVVTFAAQGIRPRRYWEADRARRATATAIVLWVVLLGALVALILAQRAGIL